MTSASSAFPEYWAALETGDSAEAVAVALRELDAGVPLLAVLDELVAAGQAEVGRRWAANEWDVAREHRATNVSEDVVANLAGRIDVAPNGRSAVIVCADGEWHALPSRLLAAALRSEGWRVTFLGASVPARHLGDLVHDVGPDVIAVSCALPTRLFEARRMIEVSRGAGVPVVVGGRGFGPDGRWGLALGANAWAPDARSALAALRDLDAFTTPAPPLDAPMDVVDVLRDGARTVVDRSVARMTAELTDVARYDPTQRQRTEEDVQHIVDFLGAALYVDDVALFTDFVRWLRDILVARRVPAATLRNGLAVVAEVVAEQFGDGDSLGRALEFLGAGIAAV